MGQAINADEACHILDVSRETKERLKAFVAVLKRWQKSINLVSRSTLDEVWGRHILDCGQVYRHITDTDADVMDILSYYTSMPAITTLATLATHLPSFDLQNHLLERRPRRSPASHLPW